MFNEFDCEDYVSNPSEFDCIVEDAEIKIRDLFTTRIKTVINEAKEAEEKLDDLKRQIETLEHQKIRSEQELLHTLEKVEKAEMYDVPKKYIDKFVRNATKGVAPKDTVWIVESSYEYEDCKFCNMTGKVEAMIGTGETTMINCPKCNGAKRISKITYIVKRRIVSDVRLKLCFDDEGRVRYWNKENIYVRGRDSYVLPENIFFTEEEAIREADKRNKKQLKNNKN